MPGTWMAAYTAKELREKWGMDLGPRDKKTQDKKTQDNNKKEGK